MAKLSESARKTMLRLHTQTASDARLYNFTVAVRTTIATGESATWVPLQPSAQAEGGRPSIYDLPADEECLMGTYVTASRVVNELVTRTADDEYWMRQISGNGEVLFSGNGTLEVLDPAIGYGRIVYRSTTPGATSVVQASVPVHVWVGFSLIKVDVG